MLNYFEFFDLPVAFGLDEKLLKEKYYQNTRNFHPDYFGQASEATQAEMLALSTLNNTAYKTLSNSNRRVQYILEIHGLVTEGEKYSLPAAFLAEMMEVNEEVMELKIEPNPMQLQQTEQQVLQLESNCHQQLQQFEQFFDATPDEEEKHSLLMQIKEQYYKNKYILRLKETLSTFAAL